MHRGRKGVNGGVRAWLALVMAKEAGGELARLRSGGRLFMATGGSIWRG